MVKKPTQSVLAPIDGLVLVDDIAECWDVGAESFETESDSFGMIVGKDRCNE